MIPEKVVAVTPSAGDPTCFQPGSERMCRIGARRPGRRTPHWRGRPRRPGRPHVEPPAPRQRAMKRKQQRFGSNSRSVISGDHPHAVSADQRPSNVAWKESGSPKTLQPAKETAAGGTATNRRKDCRHDAAGAIRPRRNNWVRLSGRICYTPAEASIEPVHRFVPQRQE